MKKILYIALVAVFILVILSAFTACNSNRNALICGITDFDPMNFRDAGGNWIGFDTEFARLVGGNLKMEVVFKQITWGQKYNELESGNINCIWNGFTANTAESDTGRPRSDYVDFSYGYLLNQQCVVVKAARSAEFKSLGDLPGKTVAVERSSAGDSFVSETVGSAGEIIGFAAQRDTFIEVKSGAVDCAVIDFLLAQKTVGLGDFTDLVIADIELKSEVYAVGFKKGSGLRDKVNQAMKKLYEDGRLLSLAQKYGLENSLMLDMTTKY